MNRIVTLIAITAFLEINIFLLWQRKINKRQDALNRENAAYYRRLHELEIEWFHWKHDYYKDK